MGFGIGIGISPLLGFDIGGGAPSIDPDAQAFIIAASITDPTQQSAINNLVIGLKADSLWTKMKAIYPMVGGTSTSHSYNLVNTAQYQITWVGGVTHSANGITGNGVNGYGNTNLIPSSALTNNSLNVTVYSRTSTQNGATEMGCSTSGFLPIIGLTTRGANGILFDGYDFSAHRLQVANSDGRGFYHGNILTSTDQKIYKNGVQVATNSVAQTQSQPSVRPLFILSRNDSGTPANYSDKNLAFASIGDGLLDSEANNLYLCVQQFNTTLGRQV